MGYRSLMSYFADAEARGVEEASELVQHGRRHVWLQQRHWPAWKSSSGEMEDINSKNHSLKGLKCLTSTTTSTSLQGLFRRNGGHQLNKITFWSRIPALSIKLTVMSHHWLSNVILMLSKWWEICETRVLYSYLYSYQQCNDNKLGDAIAISKSETINHWLTDWPTDWQG